MPQNSAGNAGKNKNVRSRFEEVLCTRRAMQGDETLKNNFQRKIFRTFSFVFGEGSLAEVKNENRRQKNEKQRNEFAHHPDGEL